MREQAKVEEWCKKLPPRTANCRKNKGQTTAISPGSVLTEQQSEDSSTKGSPNRARVTLESEMVSRDSSKARTPFFQHKGLFSKPYLFDSLLSQGEYPAAFEMKANLHFSLLLKNFTEKTCKVWDARDDGARPSEKTVEWSFFSKGINQLKKLMFLIYQLYFYQNYVHLTCKKLFWVCIMFRALY